MIAIEYAKQANDVFVLPDAVMRIKQLIDDDSASMEDIADVINFDPALTGQVLRIANSAIYNFPNRIESISKATQVLGTNSIYDLVIAYGVARAFGTVDAAVIDLDRFWEQSVFCALLSKYFADRLGIKESERFFVAGLLHNVGELVMVRFNPELAKECAQFNESITPVELQREKINATYADMGAHLIKNWGLPNSISDPIARQHFGLHEAKTLDDKILQLTCVLALDNANQEIYGGNANLQEEMYQALDLKEEDLSAALSYTNLQSLSVFALFNPTSFAM